jgi:hypothetical protein
MSNAELCAQIEEAFPGCAFALPDAFIEANPDLSSQDASAGLQVVVPAYMAWCARNGHRPEELVHDYTLRALAEFGRSKSPAAPHLNFKHTCSPEQRAVVEKFLRWCLDPALLLHVEQVERSLKHWSARSV